MSKKTKKERLIERGVKLGLDADDIRGLKVAYRRGDQLANWIRTFQSETDISKHLVQELFMSAFVLTMGEIRFLHLWWDGAISDEQMDAEMKSRIQIANKRMFD